MAVSGLASLPLNETRVRLYRASTKHTWPVLKAIVELRDDIFAASAAAWIFAC